MRYIYIPSVTQTSINQHEQHVSIHLNGVYNFAFGTSSVGSSMSRTSLAASER